MLSTQVDAASKAIGYLTNLSQASSTKSARNCLLLRIFLGVDEGIDTMKKLLTSWKGLVEHLEPIDFQNALVRRLWHFEWDRGFAEGFIPSINGAFRSALGDQPFSSVFHLGRGIPATDMRVYEKAKKKFVLCCLEAGFESGIMARYRNPHASMLIDKFMFPLIFAVPIAHAFRSTLEYGAFLSDQTSAGGSSVKHAPLELGSNDRLTIIEPRSLYAPLQLSELVWKRINLPRLMSNFEERAQGKICDLAAIWTLRRLRVQEPSYNVWVYVVLKTIEEVMDESPLNGHSESRWTRWVFNSVSESLESSFRDGYREMETELLGVIEYVSSRLEQDLSLLLTSMTGWRDEREDDSRLVVSGDHTTIHLQIRDQIKAKGSNTPWFGSQYYIRCDLESLELYAYRGLTGPFAFVGFYLTSPACAFTFSCCLTLVT
jgi:hypothetical protein